MPFQLDGSRFDRPKVVDFARRRNLEKPLSLSLSASDVFLIRRSLQPIELSSALATRVRGIGVLAC